MGTKFAPVYATLTIGYLEKNLYQEINKLFGNDFGTYCMTNWKRFLDDCFGPWTKSSEDLATLHTTLTNLHKDITFTLQYNNKEQSFLDVLVKHNEGKIETDIFIKKQIENSTCCLILATLDISR